MKMVETSLAFETTIRSVSKFLNAIGMICLLIMMLLTVVDVLLRSFLNSSIPGTVELTEYLMVMVGFLCLGWCAMKGGNIKVEIIVSHLPPRLQAAMDSVTILLCLVTFALITWQNYVTAREVQAVGQASTILGIPSYPFYFVVVIGSGILCLGLLTMLVRNILGAIKS